MGLSFERIQKLRPRMILASVKAFGPGPFENYKIYENAAQCVGGAASTTGFRDGLPLVTSAQIGDAGAGIGIIAKCTPHRVRLRCGKTTHGWAIPQGSRRRVRPEKREAVFR